jgi:G3E family GTPase
LDVDIVSGYLGAGKTTCLQGLIERDPEPSRLAVLVNEFGDVGVDALLLDGSTDVVELASGCICCTLRIDFRAQILEMAERWQPRRLLVEPSGIATTSQVLRALRQPALAAIVDGTRVIVLVDSVTFMERLRQSETFFTSQVKSGHVILLNKTDLVSPSRVKALVSVLETMNPEAWVVPTVRGRLPEGAELPPFRPLQEPDEGQVIEGLVSHSFLLNGESSLTQVREFFAGLVQGRFGQVERAKGVVNTDQGWKKFDVASGGTGEEPWSPVVEGRLVVIGSELDVVALEEAVSGLERGR